VRSADPTTALRLLRGMLSADLEALVELQLLFNAALAEQGDQLSVVEGNLEDATADAARGNRQLFLAVKSKAFRSTKKVALAAAVLGFCVGGPVGAAVGGSVAAAVISAGAIAVVGCTATACTLNSYQRLQLRNLQRQDPNLLLIGAPAVTSSSSPSSPAALPPPTSRPPLGPERTASVVAGSFADAARQLEATARRPPPGVPADAAAFRAPGRVAAELAGAMADGGGALVDQREQLQRCQAVVRHFQQQMEYSEKLLQRLGVSAVGVAAPPPRPTSKPAGSPLTRPPPLAEPPAAHRRTASAPPAEWRPVPGDDLSMVAVGSGGAPRPTAERSQVLHERERLYRQAAAELDTITQRLLVARGEEQRQLTAILCDAMKEIGGIEEVLSGIHTQARAINAELGDQNEALDELAEGVGTAVEQNRAANSWIAKLLGR